jgi:hypothetical protein
VPRRSLTLLTVLVTAAALAPAAVADQATRSPELSETSRLTDRRALVTGERAWVMGDEAGLYPAAGFHTRGEMGGFWSPPVKLLDGLWFAVDGRWLGEDVPATRYTRGWGYQRFDYAGAGITAERVEFVPDGQRAVVVGLTLRGDARREVTLSLDAHSELMPAYPWGSTTPSADGDTPDTGRFAGDALEFRDTGGTAPRDYAAYVGSSRRPDGHALGSAHRGPQDPPVICPAEGTAPARCDDSTFGKGTGGRLDYRVRLEPGRGTTVWFAVAGTDTGTADARAGFDRALRDPAGALRDTVRSRRERGGTTVVDLPGDRLLQRSVEQSKQNLLDSVQEVRDLEIRDTAAGTRYPPPVATVPRARWLAAGFPDYPWLFATDGEYTAYAAVAAGRFDVVKDHLRALRDVSEPFNGGSGKVVHEVVYTGDVYFGSNGDAGNTDETAKFPSAVALVWRWTGDDAFRDEMYDFSVRGLRYVTERLDADGDGWPEGLANVERAGMGEEKLDSAVYLVRGLHDLADLAAAKGDEAVRSWAQGRADALRTRFEQQWWVPEAVGYAESIDDPDDPANDNTPIVQRHWTGVTPMEAVGGGRPVASAEHGAAALAQRERDCYTGEFGLFHTGTGPTSAPAGNPGPSCDPLVSEVAAERAVFSLNTAVMAVAEGNFGRLAQQRRYTTGNARIQLDPAVWETPGAMPEIAPSPDFTANVDRPFTDRSMALQAWGTYGVLWPVVHQQLGVDPDLGNGRLAVVPQVPDGQDRVSGSHIAVGGGEVRVTATRTGALLRTDVAARGVRGQLTVGAVVPAGQHVAEVRLDGRRVPHAEVTTSRGVEVRVVVAGSSARLDVRLGR